MSKKDQLRKEIEELIKKAINKGTDFSGFGDQLQHAADYDIIDEKALETMKSLLELQIISPKKK